jgi:hypothetical protein
MEQWRIASLSFKMWGSMSPTKEAPVPLDTKSKVETEPKKFDPAAVPKRSIGQAEIESAYYKVSRAFKRLDGLSSFTFFLISTTARFRIILKCSFKWVTWCCSRRHFHWQDYAR